jgi:oxygen-independent coproporphyrinogen-3 oxidase
MATCVHAAGPSPVRYADMKASAHNGDTSADLAGDTGAVTSAASPIGWYVHLPFCTTKCGYCDFYSLPTIPSLVEGLIAAILTEARLRDPRRPVETVFVGGGTPTVLPATALDAILTAIARHTGPVAEFTVEANPSSTDELKLDLLRRRGVSRVSFGAQSFHADELAVLERIHDPRHIVESVLAARAAGFDNVNLDLIYAVPGQSLERWRDNLRRAIDLGTEHLSCYSLMFEPGTALTRLRDQGRVGPVDEGLEADMFDLTVDELTAAGFEQYEISNFARPGRRCRANLIYWQNREYLGIGPSAVSYLDGLRTKNAADVRRYVEHFAGGAKGEGRVDAGRSTGGGSGGDGHNGLDGEDGGAGNYGAAGASGNRGVGAALTMAGVTLPLASAADGCRSIIVESERLEPVQRAAETAVQMLRLVEGVELAGFMRQTGFDGGRLFAAAIDRLAPLGLLEATPTHVRLSRRGMLVANRVMAEFLECAEQGRAIVEA